jgi:predicted enzyme related to lactoylglutathione lyase
LRFNAEALQLADARKAPMETGLRGANMAALAITFTKLMVGDLDAAERFFTEALGFKVVGRFFAGVGPLSQELRGLSTTDRAEDSRFVISRFLERAAPPPGEACIGFLVEDVDASARAVVAAGGRIVKPATDETDFGVRAAIVTGPEGHLMELTQMLAATP